MVNHKDHKDDWYLSPQFKYMIFHIFISIIIIIIIIIIINISISVTTGWFGNNDVARDRNPVKWLYTINLHEIEHFEGSGLPKT